MPQENPQFSNLSIKDLLDGREAFHLHLMKKENVVGTAIGKYRHRTNKEGRGAKKLDNTQVDETSWPCILVFVRKWLTKGEFSGAKLDNYVPTRVYLPDGREIPLCVIEAPSLDASRDMINEDDIIFPSDFVGGGYPLLLESQGVEKLASIGCIVSDGNKYYAVTNRHVTGEPGTVVYTKVKGVAVPIGKSAAKNIGNVAFDKLYKGWTASDLVTNVDVGLIEIDDIRYWKTEVFNIGHLGKVFDLNTSNFSLSIIGSPIKAFGAASGALQGEVTALFYRYKSVGGREYVSDFLIGPVGGEPSLNTKNGDSGTLWVMASKDKDGNDVNQPMGIQWGQHCFAQGGTTLKYNYALASCLSNILRELEVDIVSGWNEDSEYTWGEVGHYTIANFATALVKNTELKKLFSNNLELITFQQADLVTDAAIKRQRKNINYVPLADVPDLVWKLRSGKHKRSLENPNHFADMDKKDSNNQTLLSLCTGTGGHMKFLTPGEWLSYYTDKSVKDSSKGILPFRVWQIFLEMVNAASKGNRERFIAAAGVLAHYVGDACQPLHISYMYNGIPVEGRGEAKEGDGVHEAFEAKMVNKYNKEILTLVGKLVAKAGYKRLTPVGSGKEAAALTVTLMQNTFKTIQPKTIVDAFVRDGSGFVDAFWKQKGKTVVPGLFARGAQVLASLWNGAWVLGKGSSKIRNLDGIDPEEIIALYESEDFLPSTNILRISKHLDL